jgi:hypothetical protein
VANFIRGGRPTHVNGTTGAATVEKWAIKGGPTLGLMVNNHGAVDLEVFLTKEAADTGAGAGVLIGASFGLDIGCEVIEFWTRSAVPVAFRAVALCRP